MVMAVAARHPEDANVPLRADRMLLLPVNLKLAASKALSSFRLPTGFFWRWCDKVNGVLALTGDQMAGSNITRINDVFSRQQVALRQVVLDDGRHDEIRGCGRRRFHVGDHMGQIGITGLRHMDFVSRPLRAAFPTVTRFGIMR